MWLEKQIATFYAIGGCWAEEWYVEHSSVGSFVLWHKMEQHVEQLVAGTGFLREIFEAYKG